MTLLPFKTGKADTIITDHGDIIDMRGVYHTIIALYNACSPLHPVYLHVGTFRPKLAMEKPIENVAVLVVKVYTMATCQS